MIFCGNDTREPISGVRLIPDTKNIAMPISSAGTIRLVTIPPPNVTREVSHPTWLAEASVLPPERYIAVITPVKDVIKAFMLVTKSIVISKSR